MRTYRTQRTCTVVIRLCYPNEKVETYSRDFTHITRHAQSLGHCSIGVQMSQRDGLKGRFLGTLYERPIYICDHAMHLYIYIPCG
jgi:hypothetical protein